MSDDSPTPSGGPQGIYLLPISLAVVAGGCGARSAGRPPGRRRVPLWARSRPRPVCCPGAADLPPPDEV